jgi:hypothetical protein
MILAAIIGCKTFFLWVLPCLNNPLPATVNCPFFQFVNEFGRIVHHRQKLNMVNVNTPIPKR